ncbi:MAG: ArnT family glycosyltransferase [Kofleriaceae bacterium]
MSDVGKPGERRARSGPGGAAEVRGRWLLLGVAALVLVVHTMAYNFVTDDAYISFVYSRNLAEHGELTFNLGQYVEGYTNFLWTVLLAGFMKLGIEPELSCRVLALICSLVTLWLVTRIMDRALGRASVWSAVPSLLLACSSGFACWTSGGLETQLFTMLVVIALDGLTAAVLHPRAILRAGLALALSAMTRPEGLLVAAVFGLVHVSTMIGRKRLALVDLAGAAVFLVVWAPWFYWRYRYYGYPFPNTYYVKADGPWANPKLEHEMWKNGTYYIWVWLKQTKLLYVAPLALLGMVVGRPRTPRFTLALALILVFGAYIPYTISVGGDFMGLHRFVMPLFVAAALAVTLGLEWLVGLFAATAAPRVAAAAVLVLGFAATQALLTRESLRWGNFANDRGIDTPAFLIVYTEDRAAIGRAMAGCFEDDDFSIVGGAGAQPYFARMRGIDVFGLVSERIAHEEPRIRARAGHTKFATERLLAEYDPTFVFSCYSIHGKPNPASPPQLPCAGFWKARGYEQATMFVPQMRQQGTYYTFLVKKTRKFECPGRVL